MTRCCPYMDIQYVQYNYKNSRGLDVKLFLFNHFTLIWMTSGLEVMWQLHWKQLSF